MPGTRLQREQDARRRALCTGAAGFAAAVVLPVVLWHGTVADIAGEYEFTLRYLVAGWTPWFLMALGLACFVVAAAVEWRNRGRRFYRPGGGAWFGWGVTFYLLGFGLATQVSQIAGGLSPA
jgi:hypothetical protein